MVGEDYQIQLQLYVLMQSMYYLAQLILIPVIVKFLLVQTVKVTVPVQEILIQQQRPMPGRLLLRMNQILLDMIIMLLIMMVMQMLKKQQPLILNLL